MPATAPLLLLRRKTLTAEAARHVPDRVLQRLVLAIEGFAVLGDGFNLRGDCREAGLHVLCASVAGEMVSVGGLAAEEFFGLW